VASARPRVVILGGGFAGVGAAQKLKGADAEVVLVDRHDYHTFQPLLYQLASGLLETTAVGHSLRDLLERQENTSVHQATVTAVDLEAREVRFDGLAPLSYDYLVVGLGAFAPENRPGGAVKAASEPAAPSAERRAAPTSIEGNGRKDVICSRPTFTPICSRI